MSLQDEYELREARSAFEDQQERMMPIAASPSAMRWNEKLLG
jgi:hypothetical protein